MNRARLVGNRVLFALLAVLLLAVHTYNFADIDFRDDEIRTVHAGMTMTPGEVIAWMAQDIHPPFWRVLATSWVTAFGPDEGLARFSSTLFTALTLALMYRLAADLFDRRTALFAVLLLGVHSLYAFYTHELRPYAMLVMWMVALHLTFLRWVKRPSFGLALAYVVCGIAAIYTHFFALFVIAGQAGALLLTIRNTGGRYLRAFGLFALIGLSFAGWLPPFLHSFLVTKPGGVDYGIRQTGLELTRSVYGFLQIRPYELGNLLIGLALLLPARWLRLRPTGSAFRSARRGPVLYFICVIVAVLVLSLLVNTQVEIFTRRNLVTLVPCIALLAALALRALPWQAAVLITLLLLDTAATEVIRYETAEPYRAIASIIVPGYQLGDVVAISVDRGGGDYFGYAYYLMDQLPGVLTQDNMVYMTYGEPRVNLPEPVRNIITSELELSRFNSIVGQADQVWWISTPFEPSHARSYRSFLLDRYVLADSWPIPVVEGVFPHTVFLYERTQ